MDTIPVGSLSNTLASASVSEKALTRAHRQGTLPCSSLCWIAWRRRSNVTLLTQFSRPTCSLCSWRFVPGFSGPRQGHEYQLSSKAIQRMGTREGKTTRYTELMYPVSKVGTDTSSNLRFRFTFLEMGVTRTAPPLLQNWVLCCLCFNLLLSTKPRLKLMWII